MSRRTDLLNRTMSVFLATVERGGNALPHPGTLFAILAGVIVVISAIAARTGLEVTHPGTGELIQPVSLATVDGLHRILTEMVTNFTSFAPLGTVLVAMLGIGVMESSGLIGAALRLLVLSAPKRLLTFVIVLAGVLSNTASEIGYVLLVPLGGIIFLGAGRHPIAGLHAFGLEAIGELAGKMVDLGKAETAPLCDQRRLVAIASRPVARDFSEISQHRVSPAFALSVCSALNPNRNQPRKASKGLRWRTQQRARQMRRRFLPMTTSWRRFGPRTWPACCQATWRAG
ncbi:MAG: AbgT family transporter [Vicinamibacterales bacterium]|nr:AbgT family transporter [Vicinamibacterales bacterium]